MHVYKRIEVKVQFILEVSIGEGGGVMELSLYMYINEMLH